MLEARLFGEGLADGGQAVGVHWRGAALAIAGDRLNWSAEVTALAAAGFEGRDLRLDLGNIRQEDGEGAAPVVGAYSLFVAAPMRDALMRDAPPALAGKRLAAERASRRLDSRFRLALAALALLLLVPLAGLVWMLSRPDAIAAWVVERIPVAQEVALGDLVLAQTRSGMSLQESGGAVAAVRTIGESLVGESAYRYRWFVAERDELNAFAAPGGVVVVFAGLLRAADTPEELAGVLAHEIAHAELRHGLRALVKRIGLRAAIAAVFGDFGGGLLADGAAQLTELKFSRDAEREADAEGLRRLLRAEVDPQGMLRFFARLADAPQNVPPALFSTHPDSEERRQVLATEIARQPRRDWRALPVDWPAARAALPPADTGG